MAGQETVRVRTHDESPVVAAQFPTAWSRLTAGEWLEFGAFRISRTAVGGHRVALWIRVLEITVHEGLVRVRAAQEGKSVLLQAYPSELVGNLDLFWALALRLRAERAPSPPPKFRQECSEIPSGARQFALG